MLKQFRVSADILSKNIELEVHLRSDFDGVEVGVVVSVGDNVYFERVERRIAYREAHTVHGD